MYHKLLVPVDHGELSDRAMRAGLDLARQLGKVSVIGFVVEPLSPGPQVGTTLAEYARANEEHVARTDAAARAVLTRFEGLAAEAGVEFHGLHAQSNSIDQAIVETARAEGVDMIVMVTHGRGIFGELLFGSHSKAVLAQTDLPVLILR